MSLRWQSLGTTLFVPRRPNSPIFAAMNSAAASMAKRQSGSPELVGIPSIISRRTIREHAISDAGELREPQVLQSFCRQPECIEPRGLAAVDQHDRLETESFHEQAREGALLKVGERAQEPAPCPLAQARRPGQRHGPGALRHQANRLLMEIATAGWK